jgi:predicted XRE-type DNA-binding protein
MTVQNDHLIEDGTDNLFADLGFADPDTHLLKAQLVAKIAEVVKGRQMTQVAAAKTTGMGQPAISRILKGQFRDVSVERLMRMLTRLGCAVDIVVRPEGVLAEGALAPAAIIHLSGVAPN